MNGAFISEIFTADKALPMQSENERLVASVEISDVHKKRLGNFELLEEFSGRSIAGIIKERRINFDEADAETRKRNLAAVKSEVDRFRVWLEETKGLEPEMAHYYSVSLMSLLLGLPIGEQVSELFSSVLDRQSK